jgi:hypothetical protein
VAPDAMSRFCIMLLLGAMLLTPVDLPAVSKSGWTDLIERIAEAVTAPPA